MVFANRQNFSKKIKNSKKIQGTHINCIMSILKSTGLGADKARMDILYGRREEFYNEINVWNSDKEVKDGNLLWKVGKSKVYTSEEYSFIKQYILKFGWFDEKFVSKIKNPVPSFSDFWSFIQTNIFKV